MVKRIVLLAVSAAAAASCGGGGGGPDPHPETDFRANAVGDSWSYEVHIDFGQFGAYHGVLNNELTSDTYAGNASVRDTQTFLLQLKTGPATITSYSESSPQGQLLADMVSDVLYGVTSDTFSIGSTIGTTTNDSGVITLSDGETIAETFKVVGADWVQTRLGPFACWIVKEKVAASSGSTDNFTLWMAPQIGTYVKITDETTSTTQSGYTYTAVLTSMVTASASAARGPTMRIRPSLIPTPSHLLPGLGPNRP